MLADAEPPRTRRWAGGSCCASRGAATASAMTRSCSPPRSTRARARSRSSSAPASGPRGSRWRTACRGSTVRLVEMDPTLADLARENAARNQLADRVSVARSTSRRPAGIRAAAIAPERRSRPDESAVQRSGATECLARRGAPPRACRASDDARATGSIARLRCSAPHGTLTLIWRADGLGDVLAALAGFGAITILPIHPKPDAAAIRILVRAVRGGGAPLVLLPPLDAQRRGRTAERASRSRSARRHAAGDAALSRRPQQTICPDNG